MEYCSNSEQETEALGSRLGERLKPGSVIAYTGDLGAGKTAFTRGLARGLGIPGQVTSPTFTIVNEYEGGRLPLFHFDMYRLGSADELFDIGWEDCGPGRYMRRGVERKCGRGPGGGYHPGRHPPGRKGPSAGHYHPGRSLTGKLSRQECVIA